MKQEKSMLETVRPSLKKETSPKLKEIFNDMEIPNDVEIVVPKKISELDIALESIIEISKTEVVIVGFDGE